MGFDEIVAGLELEPITTTIVRGCLAEDWDERHPDDPNREAAHQVIDEVVDDLRIYWGPGVFDGFVASQAGR